MVVALLWVAHHVFIAHSWYSPCQISFRLGWVVLPDEGCSMDLMERDTYYSSPNGFLGHAHFWLLWICTYTNWAYKYQSVWLWRALPTLSSPELTVTHMLHQYFRFMYSFPSTLTSQLAGCGHQHMVCREGLAWVLHRQMSDFTLHAANDIQRDGKITPWYSSQGPYELQVRVPWQQWEWVANPDSWRARNLYIWGPSCVSKWFSLLLEHLRPVTSIVCVSLWLRPLHRTLTRYSIKSEWIEREVDRRWCPMIRTHC